MENDEWKIDKCMESIRARIKSCIPCNEDQCSIIRERLEQHILSHHSSKRSLNSQSNKFFQKASGAAVPPRNDVFEKGISTSEENFNNEMVKKTGYKEALRDIIYEWSNELQITNSIAENIKQNMVNELVENIYKLSKEKNDRYYDVKLINEIDRFLNPPTNQFEITLNKDALKEKIVNKINYLNNKNFKFNKEVRTNKFKKNKIVTNTSSYIDEFKKEKFDQSYTSIQDSLINLSGAEDTISAGNKQNVTKSVATQVQESLINYDISSHESIYNTELTKPENIDDSKVYNQKILEWVIILNDKYYLNVDNEDIKFLVKNLFDRLKSFLQMKTYTTDDKLLLRGEILDFLLENMNVSESTENMSRLNKLANDLALDLLIEKNNKAMIYNTLYSMNKIKDTNYANIQTDIYKNEIIYDIVANSLENYDLYSDGVFNKITDCVLENMNSMTTTRDKKFEFELFTILKQLTCLPNFYINDIINTIIEDIKRKVTLTNNILRSKGNMDNLRNDRIISVYNSEHDLYGSYNNSIISLVKRKSKIDYPVLNPEERDFMNKISFLITDWINTLPVQFRKSLTINSRQLFINNLTNDILDQVKLHNLAEINSEKEKYIYFFAYRWLRRFEYFEKIDKAKPYVDLLINKIKEISTPQLTKKTQIKNSYIDKINTCFSLTNEVNTYNEKARKDKSRLKELNISRCKLKSESVMEEYIRKCIEHTNDTEMSATRDAFNELLKDEIVTQTLRQDKNKLLSLPIKPNKEVVLPVSVRFEQGNEINKQIYENNIKVIESTSNNMHPHTCCSKVLAENQRRRDLRSDMTNLIETWCSKLPIETNSESTINKIKEKVATKLYQKLGQLNMNPQYYNDDILYRKMFAEEVERQLETLPQSHKIQSIKKDLIMQLLEAIIEKRNEIKERVSGVKYKRNLEKTVASSMPYPVLIYQEDTPGFKICKDHLASIFILENFDHSNDAVKLNYEKRIRDKIDKYFEDVQMRNSVPLTKDEIYNELYNALFSVPVPKESSIAEEVEVIKTRCEIENWFETLPLKETTGVGQLFEWDQILAMLAKRLYEMEKYEQNSDIKIHKEIVKWLKRLPVLPGYECKINNFANNLQMRLKATLQNRKCVPRNKKGILGTSEVAALSNVSSYTDSSPNCCPVPLSGDRISKKPVDLIIEFVEKWCQQLPLPENNSQEKDNARFIKDNLAIRIIMKISELTVSPTTIDDDFLYDALLDDELDNLLTSLPPSHELLESKDVRKKQLKDAIKFVKPLFKAEKIRYDYKCEIKNTVNNVLHTPMNKSNEKSTILNSLTEEIVDNYIVYSHHQNDDQGPRIKNLIYNTIEMITSFVNEDKIGEMPSNPLIKGNELLCELSKIPVPGESAILQEVQEIEMKFKISKFFNDLPLPDDVDKLVIKNQVKTTLARRLSNYEKSGYTRENHKKLRSDLIKCLKKIDENINIQKVDSFLETLNDTQTSENKIPRRITTQKPQESLQIDESPIRDTNNDISLQNKTDEQWISLLPITAEEENLPETKDYSNKTLDQHETSYKKFEKGPVLSSSNRKDQHIQQSKPTGNKSVNCDENCNRHLNITTPGFIIPPQEHTIQNQTRDPNKPNHLGRTDTQSIRDLSEQIPNEDYFLNSSIRQDIAMKGTNESMHLSQNAQFPTETQNSCQEKRPCPPISSRIPTMRRPCRRPSMTIYNPSYLGPETRKNYKAQHKSRTQIDDEIYQCGCERIERESSKNWCSVHKQSYCRCCNRKPPIHDCGKYRHPNFYRY